MFKISYKVEDYTLDPPPVMLFGEEDREMVSIFGACYGMLPSSYVFDIIVGNYVYPVEKPRIHIVQTQLDGLLQTLLELKATYKMSEEESIKQKIDALEEGERYASFNLFYQYRADIPSWHFVFKSHENTVKVYPRLFKGNLQRGAQVPLLPPWQVVPDAPINQPPVLCSKKQIVSELYKLYLNLVQDAKKMHPEQFADEDYLGAAYEEWKEQMQVYKAAIQAL